ncbi:hypothetical protein EXS73_02400 [Candidatus Pacearchaeota archaeon]|nr:hypothetical protein [Candidatus Pacearchaeota archaeon]
MGNVAQWTIGLWAARMIDMPPRNEQARTGSLFNYKEQRPDDASSEQTYRPLFPDSTIPTFSNRGT